MATSLQADMMTEADPNLPQSKTYLFTVAMLPTKKQAERLWA